MDVCWLRSALAVKGQRAKGKCGRPTARRSVRTTGATSERSASSNAVVLLGFEPRSPALQTVVLPLNYRTFSGRVFPTPALGLSPWNPCSPPSAPRAQARQALVYNTLTLMPGPVPRGCTKACCAPLRKAPIHRFAAEWIGLEDLFCRDSGAAVCKAWGVERDRRSTTRRAA